VLGELVVHVADAPAEEGYYSNPMFHELVDVGGIRTILDIGSGKGDALFGIISLYRQEIRLFTDNQIALLESFAAPAVITIEDARVLGELWQRTEEVAELNRGLESERRRWGNSAPKPWDSASDRLGSKAGI
jgi:GAF domain-containing protein